MRHPMFLGLISLSISAVLWFTVARAQQKQLFTVPKWESPEDELTWINHVILKYNVARWEQGLKFLNYHQDFQIAARDTAKLLKKAKFNNSLFIDRHKKYDILVELFYVDYHDKNEDEFHPIGPIEAFDSWYNQQYTYFQKAMDVYEFPNIAITRNMSKIDGCNRDLLNTPVNIGLAYAYDDKGYYFCFLYGPRPNPTSCAFNPVLGFLGFDVWAEILKNEESLKTLKVDPNSQSQTDDNDPGYFMIATIFHCIMAFLVYCIQRIPITRFCI